MIRLSALTKRYGTFTAVDGIDLEVPRGELFGFLGPNGAGKTTTLRMIAGILRPTSGTVEHRRHRHPGAPARGQDAARLHPDRPFIYEKLTGGEFLRFVAGLYGQAGPGRGASDRRAAAALRSRRRGRTSSSRATATACARS